MYPRRQGLLCPHKTGLWHTKKLSPNRNRHPQTTTTAMPIYEYRCQKCGKESEILVRNSAEKPPCPHCGSKRLDKQFSIFAASGKPGGEHVHTGPGCACHHGGCGSN